MFVRNEEGICDEEDNFHEGVGYEKKRMITGCSCLYASNWVAKYLVR